MASPKNQLTPTQLALAEAFFRHNRDFFLTGGAVLVGWALGHRTTDDLDLFTEKEGALQQGDRALQRAVIELGGSLERLTTSPDFRRYLARFPTTTVKVDLVRDATPQLRAKIERDGIVMDSLEEIFVNKICTLVERSELRDVVDLMMLEREGFRVEVALPMAQQKDAGVSAATIAWLLRTLPVPDVIPGNIPRTSVVNFIKDLEARLLQLASPPGS